jgi:hypothetical protein
MRQVMDANQHDLIRHLFATPRPSPKTAREASVEGQAVYDAPYRAALRRLLPASRDLNVLVQAITVMVEPGSQTDRP